MLFSRLIATFNGNKMITTSGGALICNDWRCKNDNDTANAYDNDNCRPDGVIVAEGESSSSSFVSAEKSARDIMWYATQARDAYPYYQHTAIGYGCVRLRLMRTCT